MSGKHRSALDRFTDEIKWINTRLNDKSNITVLEMSHLDTVIDHITKLAEADYLHSVTDEQKMSVMAVLIAAIIVRTELRGIGSTPLSDLYDFLHNGAAGKPTRVNLPPKLPGATKSINDGQSEVYYVVLHKLFDQHRKELNAEAKNLLSLTLSQLRSKRYDLEKRRQTDILLDRMFQYAENEVLKAGSPKLSSYI